MKIVLGIYCVAMIIYDVVLGIEIIKSKPENWTWKNWTKAILILLGLGLIWPVCLGMGMAACKGKKK